MEDPTYNKEVINKDPITKLAFFLSEIDNDNAPIGWFKYSNLASAILSKYELVEKSLHNKSN